MIITFDRVSSESFPSRKLDLENNEKDSIRNLF